MMMSIRALVMSLAAFGLLGTGCDDQSEPDSDADGGAEGDADGDVDGDTDSDGDSDSDGDADGDAESEVDGNVAPEIEWVTIPGGSFVMGCSSGDDDCDASESPTRTVTVEAFEMAATETTQAQWAAHRDYEPSRFFDCGGTCPVETVSWEEAHQFCQDIGARLPTEAEWEYAARAGTTSRYGCGDDASCLTTVAWFFDNADLTTHPTAQLAPNGFGLYDMQGNVWEWVEDCWHDDYSGDPPTDGSAWDDEVCEYVVARGGSWGLDARGMRVSSRNGDYPDSYLLPAPGFRCAR